MNNSHNRVKNLLLLSWDNNHKGTHRLVAGSGNTQGNNPQTGPSSSGTEAYRL